jgi:hypothetical protein
MFDAANKDFSAFKKLYRRDEKQCAVQMLPIFWNSPVLWLVIAPVRNQICLNRSLSIAWKKRSAETKRKGSYSLAHLAALWPAGPYLVVSGLA